MNGKRKAFSGDARPPKKQKPDAARKEEKKAALLFTARPDWHATPLPALASNDEGKNLSMPPPRVVDELLQYAMELLEAENATYGASHMTGSASHKFLSTIMSSGTLEDKVSALTLLVQESPLHTMKAFDNLLGLSRKKSRNQALMAVAALKDLLGQGVVLPADRKLRAFGRQPALLAAMQGKNASWSYGEPLPGGLEKIHILVWAFEDWLKKKYFELLGVLETWCNDEIEYSRSRAITYVFELLKDKPEQEENLLRLLVNKLGDTDRKIASRASYLLLQLEVTHPAMKLIITNSVEADSLFRPGQSDHAKYYAIITLNQTILSQKEQELANRLLEIYFSLFVQLLKPREVADAPVKINTKGKPQGGGGKAGKMAAKKRKAEERVDESVVQLHEKMIAQVLAGVNRAFPFADTNSAAFDKQMDMIFRVAHSANFNTSIQALMLIQQISSTKHYGAERFYKTLYESLWDPRLFTSSKQVMYLNLLYKSLKADLNARRVQAFVKRLLQVITMHEPPFVCGVLYLISELETTFPSIRNMLKEPEVDDEDEEEHFVDVPEDGTSAPQTQRSSAERKSLYDPRKRDPEHSGAERTCLWDILPLVRHFHPSVSLFAEAVYGSKEMPPKPDPTQHNLMHFLDRFVYRKPRSKEAVTHGSSIMQPLAGTAGTDMLIRPGDSGVKGAPLNTEAFWAKKVEDVAADEVFFHSYFNASSNKKRTTSDKPEKKQRGDDEDSEDEQEDEIWQAIANSRPDVEGPDSDDDLSMADLESAYDDSDAEEAEGSADDDSEAGIDLGGGDDDEELGAQFEDMDGSDMEELPELDSDDEEAMFGSDDEVAVPLGDDKEEESGEVDKTARNKKQRNERKKLKQLPVFASADDYAKLLGGDDEEEY